MALETARAPCRSPALRGMVQVPARPGKLAMPAKATNLQELEARYLEAVHRRQEAEAARREAAARLHEAEDAELRILEELEKVRKAPAGRPVTKAAQ